MAAAEDARIAVFFEGTSNPISPPTTQVGLFFEACEHLDVTDEAAELPSHVPAFKMGFDGCGYAFGLLGTVFAHGLSQQCDLVERRVRQLTESRRSVSVVILGLSRGGVAALMLAKRLAAFDPAKLGVSICAFDPVPGNLVCTARLLDRARFSTANRALDCSSCRTLRRVLALYPHEPLPDLAFHAPILPRYPRHLESLEEDAVLGCHQGALYPHDTAHPSMQVLPELAAPVAAPGRRPRPGRPFPPPPRAHLAELTGGRRRAGGDGRASPPGRRRRAERRT